MRKFALLVFFCLYFSLSFSQRLVAYYDLNSIPNTPLQGIIWCSSLCSLTPLTARKGSCLRNEAVREITEVDNNGCTITSGKFDNGLRCSNNMAGTGSHAVFIVIVFMAPLNSQWQSLDRMIRLEVLEDFQPWCGSNPKIQALQLHSYWQSVSHLPCPWWETGSCYSWQRLHLGLRYRESPI